MLKLPVTSEAKVLEIGSGHNPHPRSDILCDRYLYHNTERQRFAIRYDRPFLICQGERLPFADNSFDFVLCSQILEHTENPIAFCTEISRVGKAGLIIVPEVKREYMFGWGYHHWIFYQQQKRLHFYQKDDQDLSPFGEFFHRQFQFSLALRHFLHNHDEQFNVYHYWKGKIKIHKMAIQKDKLIKQKHSELHKLLKQFNYSSNPGIAFWLYERQQRLVRKNYNLYRQWSWDFNRKLQLRKNVKTLSSLLFCIECHSKLVLKQYQFICPHCQQSFPIVQAEVPILLNQTEREKGY